MLFSSDLTREKVHFGSFSLDTCTILISIHLAQSEQCKGTQANYRPEQTIVKSFRFKDETRLKYTDGKK